MRRFASLVVVLLVACSSMSTCTAITVDRVDSGNALQADQTPKPAAAPAPTAPAAAKPAAPATTAAPVAKAPAAVAVPASKPAAPAVAPKVAPKPTAAAPKPAVPAAVPRSAPKPTAKTPSKPAAKPKVTVAPTRKNATASELSEDAAAEQLDPAGDLKAIERLAQDEMNNPSDKRVVRAVLHEAVVQPQAVNEAVYNMRAAACAERVQFRCTQKKSSCADACEKYPDLNCDPNKCSRVFTACQRLYGDECEKETPVRWVRLHRLTGYGATAPAVCQEQVARKCRTRRALCDQLCDEDRDAGFDRCGANRCAEVEDVCVRTLQPTCASKSFQA